MRRHFVMPDTQIKPNQSIEHLKWAGDYCVEMLPDSIILLGDWWDFPSLSSYDVGKKSYEGRSYKADIAAGNAGLALFMEPILKEIKRRKRGKRKHWNPELVFLEGNHEYRIQRAVETDRKLEGLMGLHDTNLSELGFETVPFLEVKVIDGVAYSHYFTSGVMGRPVTSARAMLTKKHMSCIMGHVQHRDIAYAQRADGSSMTGIFAGVYSPHEELYLNAQTNDHWRGLWVLHEVEGGSFDEMPVSLRYLEKRYG